MRRDGWKGGLHILGCTNVISNRILVNSAETWLTRFHGIINTFTEYKVFHKVTLVSLTSFYLTFFLKASDIGGISVFFLISR